MANKKSVEVIFETGNWRAESRPNLFENAPHFCMKKELADVEFVFDRPNGITKIPAHKFVLSLASAVFEKGLNYRCKVEDETENRSSNLQSVEVTDEQVNVDAFKTALLFIYNGGSIVKPNVVLTMESVQDVLYIATKYMIKSLESYCVDFLVDNLNASNVFTVLKSCNTDKQRQMCMKFIRANTDDVLNDESFLSISHKFLTRLLSDDSLTVPEIRLFEAAILWGKVACERVAWDSNDGKNIRLKLGSAIKQIRFSLMTMEQFIRFVVPCGVLSPEELRDAMLILNGSNPIGPPVSIKNSPRRAPVQPQAIDGGIKKKKRDPFTAERTRILEREYRKEKYLPANRRNRLAKATELTEAQITYWWQKKSKP